jgi:hypothetical protein
MAIVGCFSLAVAVAALAGFYVLGISQLGGSVTHNHHLVWLLALLAVSPCGDALSIIVRWARWPAPPSGHAVTPHRGDFAACFLPRNVIIVLGQRAARPTCAGLLDAISQDRLRARAGLWMRHQERVG